MFKAALMTRWLDTYAIRERSVLIEHFLIPDIYPHIS
jgi:hypothetical protein